MKTPKIKIEGITGSGKSTLAWMIKSILMEHDISCSIVGCEDEYLGIMDKSWKNRLAFLKGKTIEVETVRINSTCVNG